MGNDEAFQDDDLLRPYRMVIHRDQPRNARLIGSTGEMVRFFLPLPEALGLPDSWVRRRLVQLEGPLYAAITEATGDPDFWYEMLVSMCFLRVSRPTPAIPVSIEVARLAAQRALPESDPPPLQPPEAEKVYTVVEVAALVQNRSVDELSRVLDTAIAAIADVQASYSTVTGQSVTRLTRPRCPLAVSMFHHPPAAEPSTWHADASLFFVHDLFEQIAPSEELLGDDTLRLIDTVHGMRMESAPFLMARELMDDAIRSLRIDGEPRQAAISAGSGCESLFDELLCCMLWEDGERPEDWSKFFSQSLARRVTSSEYSGRLSGSWSVDDDGPVGLWFREVRALRNRVVHGGDEPSTGEAATAVLAAKNLFNFATQLLRKAVAKYPRTAWMAVGPALSKPAVKLHAGPLFNDSREPAWRETARRWERVMHKGVAYGEWQQSDPATELRQLVAIKHATGEVVWAIAVESGRASRIVEPVDFVSDEQRGVLAEVEVPHDMPAVSVSFTVDRRPLEPLPDAPGPWVPAYRLVPGQAVMVTGESIDAP